ncbi:MAG TPA: lysophospholipid acyltransferase family protein [Gemmatimonadaceae bacterium]
MRTLLTYTTMLFVMPALSAVIIVAGLLGVRNRPGSIYERIPRWWARLVLRCVGVRVILHDEDRVRDPGPKVYVSNHVSWFDIFVLLSILPRYRFVAKEELFRIPLFGRAARIAGTIPIRRDNRDSALQAYDQAAGEIRGGASVVVCPEGTRGESYSLRPFKKGPFVLAIAAQAPIVPVVIFGTREIQPKGRFGMRSGTVCVRFLDVIPTAGLEYAHRNELALQCWTRMADVLAREHGVESCLPRDAVSPGSDQGPGAPEVYLSRA